MKLGQTSFVVFASKLLGSALGFLSTIYFARVLGAEVLGYYALVLALVSWLLFAGNAGVGSAVTKRVSEGREQAAYAVAGFTSVVALGALFSAGVLTFDGWVERYVGRPVAAFVVVLVLLQLTYNVTTSLLNGQGTVHIAGLLAATEIVGTSAIQVVLVYAGWKLSGLLLGKVAGVLAVLLLGLFFVRTGASIPGRRHFRKLYEYARYSWVGSLKSRAYNDVDIVILGLLTPSALVGVYSVSWSISKFLRTFDTAVSQAVFPEISRIDANADREAVGPLLSNALQFSGLILIPGLVGGFLLSEQLLRIYGQEFVRGSVVLTLLIAANLFYGFQKQLITTINAIDRPDMAFRINVLFIVFNAVANVVLISLIGWVGAAIATALSALLGLVLAFATLRSLVDFDLPYAAIGKQVLAAAVMGCVVYVALLVEQTYGVVDQYAAVAIGLAAVGAVVYFTVLWLVSSTFRETVERNVPFRIPLVG